MIARILWMNQSCPTHVGRTSAIKARMTPSSTSEACDELSSVRWDADLSFDLVQFHEKARQDAKTSILGFVKKSKMPSVPTPRLGMRPYFPCVKISSPRERKLLPQRSR